MPKISLKFVVYNLKFMTKQLFFIIFVFIFGINVSVFSQIKPNETNNLSLIPQNGLVAYYPLDNNANDLSGNNNNGIIHGTKQTRNRKNQKASAFYFDGEDDYIEIPSSKTIQLGQAMSFSVWINTGYVLPYCAIFCKASAEEPRQEYLLDIFPDGKVAGYVIKNHLIDSLATGLLSKTNVVDNSWYHIVMIYTGYKLMLYINGEFESEIFYKNGYANNNEPLLIGWDKNQYLSHRHFNGAIDDFRIYNRILTKEEIIQLYNE